MDCIVIPTAGRMIKSETAENSLPRKRILIFLALAKMTQPISTQGFEKRIIFLLPINSQKYPPNGVKIIPVNVFSLIMTTLNVLKSKALRASRREYL